MARELLTLGMSYNELNRYYELICYDMLRDRIIPLDLSVNDVQGEKGIYFDIGSVTEVEVLREGGLFYPVGYKKITKGIERDTLKRLLERKKVNIEAFLSNKSINPYSIVKVEHINKLEINRNHYLMMSFYSGGKLSTNLVKDYRWLAYKGQLEENQERMDECMALLKNQSKSLFLVMHRSREDFISIVGIHYL